MVNWLIEPGYVLIFEQLTPKPRKESRMKHSHAHANQTTRRVLLLACVTVLIAAIRPADANRDFVSPSVPDNLEVAAGNKLFLVGHAVGTQQYICLPSGSSVAWT